MKNRSVYIDGKHYSVMLGDSFFLRLRGLVGRTLDSNEGFWLTPCSQVHTWFMSYPIDILYFDKQLRVLHCDRQVPPWRMLWAVRGAKHVIELSSGSVNSEQDIVLEVERDANC